MRNIVLFLFVGIVLGCTQQKKTNDYKIVRDEVMQFHDVVMKDQSVLVSNQMKLDTLSKNLKDLKLDYPEIDTLKEAAGLKKLVADLTVADDAMNDWMHQFEPDVSGLSNEQAIAYFKAEKQKIASIDSVYKKEIKASSEYLQRFKK